MFWQPFKECLQITVLINFCSRNLCLRSKSFLSFELMESLLNSLQWKTIKISSALLILSLHIDLTSIELEQIHKQYLKDLKVFITLSFVCVWTSVTFSPPINILPDHSFALLHWYCICEIPVGSPGVNPKVVIKLMSLNSRTYKY